MPGISRFALLKHDIPDILTNTKEPHTTLVSFILTFRSASFWKSGLFSPELFVRHVDFVKFAPSTHFCRNNNIKKIMLVVDYGPIWIRMDPYGSVWTHMGLYIPLCQGLTLFPRFPIYEQCTL